MATAKKVNVYEVERGGTKVLIPEKCSIPQVIESLQRKHSEEEEEVQAQEVFSFYPSEGAVALGRVLSVRYGFTIQEASFGMFGSKIPPGNIAVDTAWGKSIQVPWASKVAIPGLEGGVLVPLMAMKEGLPVFRLVGQFKGKYRHEFEELCQAIKDEVHSNSIYKGQAIEFKWPEDPENASPGDWFPKFLAPGTLAEEDIIFSLQTARDVAANVFAPVKYTGAMTEVGMPLRTGVLLYGPYGCGKTMVLSVLQRLCVRHGWTYVYCPSPKAVLQALQFALASDLGPTVLACEDIDAFDGDVNVLQNRMDGVESKGSSVKLVVTTNFVDKIQERMPALVREGRLGVHIPIQPPDGVAVERLIRRYAGPMLPWTEDLERVSAYMAGWLPASIAGAVQAAQRYALDRQEGLLPIALTATDLEDAAGYMAASAARALRAFTEARGKEEDSLVRAATIVAKALQPKGAEVTDLGDMTELWGYAAK